MPLSRRLRCITARPPVFQDASFLPALRTSSAPPIVLELEPVLGPAVVEVEDDQTAYIISGP